MTLFQIPEGVTVTADHCIWISKKVLIFHLFFVGVLNSPGETKFPLGTQIKPGSPSTAVCFKESRGKGGFWSVYIFLLIKPRDHVCMEKPKTLLVGAPIPLYLLLHIHHEAGHQTASPKATGWRIKIRSIGFEDERRIDFWPQIVWLLKKYSGKYQKGRHRIWGYYLRNRCISAGIRPKGRGLTVCLFCNHLTTRYSLPNTNQGSVV